MTDRSLTGETRARIVTASVLWMIAGVLSLARAPWDLLFVSVAVATLNTVITLRCLRRDRARADAGGQPDTS